MRLDLAFLCISTWWGLYHQEKGSIKIEMLYGAIKLKKIHLATLSNINSIDIKINEKDFEHFVEDCEINFLEGIELKNGEILKISFI